MEKYIAIHIATHFMFDMFYGVTVWSAKPMTQSDSLETSTVESGVFFTITPKFACSVYFVTSR